MADQCFWPTPAKRGRPPRHPQPTTPQPTVKILPAAAPLDVAAAGGAVGHIHAAASVPPPQRPQPEPEAAPMTTAKRRRHQGGDDEGLAPGDGAPAVAAEDLGSAATAFLVNMVAGLKADMRAMAAQMKKMEKKAKKKKQKKLEQGNNGNNEVVAELQRRVEQLEEDNVQLHVQLAHVAASRYGVAGAATAPAPGLFAAPPPPPFSCAQQQQQQQRRSSAGEVGRLGPEMLWCFPFLQHYDIPADRFVVDDIQKAIAVVGHPGGEGRQVAFANHQFCRIVGFSMVELLGRQILGVSPMHEKHKLRRALQNRGQTGYSESNPPCLFQLECKGGHFAKVVSRVQFFFGPDAQLRWSVLCVDQVLGVDLVPFTIEEARRKEDAEWELAFSSVARDHNGNDDCEDTSSSLAPPSTSPTASEDDFASFGDFISSSPPAPWEALPETTP